MLQSTLRTFLHHHGLHRTYCIAYSGGLDSRVLLHLCVQLRQEFPFPLKAIHVHHGLSPQADHWLQHCKEICEQEQVDFLSLAIDTKPGEGESLEDFARKHRYQQLSQVLAPEDILLTAHHQDDQAETVLLQLMRGAGPKGLSAMPAIKSLGVGWHGRPLLAFTRAALEAYAKANQLSWVNDEMNIDPQYSRNYCRHELMPILKKRWPTVAATIARVAENCAQVQTLLDSYVSEDLKRVQGVKSQTLSVRRLLALDPIKQKCILRSWFEREGVLLPSAVKLHQILGDVLQARRDRSPCVGWGGIELRRYQDDLYLLPALPAYDKEKVYTWDFSHALSIPGIGKLTARPSDTGLSKALSTVQVRFRRGGEVYRLATGSHHELKKFFQEQHIPPWLRDRLPLIYVKEELAAVPGYFVVEEFKARPFEGGYELDFHY